MERHLRTSKDRGGGEAESSSRDRDNKREDWVATGTGIVAVAVDNVIGVCFHGLYF